MSNQEISQQITRHLQTLIAMVMELPVTPSPSEVGRLQGQAAKYLIWSRMWTCEALVVSNSEDCYGQLCGKACVEGEMLCQEHLNQQRAQWES